MFRRTWAQIWFAVIMALAVTAGCGGGGGGGGTGGTGGPGGGLAIGAFTKQFAPSDPLDLFFYTDPHGFPFSDVVDTKTQYLYTPAEIGGSGKITKIRLHKYDVTFVAVTCPNTTIKMGHTSIVSSLTTTWASNVANGVGAEQTVLDNATITIPADAVSLTGPWIDITLGTPFYYNGIDNLIVDFERTTACSNLVNTTHFRPADNRRAYSWGPDDNPGIADYNTINADAVDNYQPWMQFVFAGGEVALDFGGSDGTGVPFSLSGSPYRTQSLYLASDILGSGPITGIALQTDIDSAFGVARTFTFTMTLSHTTATVLSDTFANNYSGTKTTVASAVTFMVPDGLPGGSWVWVPIPSGTFTYNGIDNLIVEVATTDASDDVSWRGLLTGTPGTRVLADGPGVTATTSTGTVDDFALNVKLRFNGGPMSVITDGAVSTPNAFNTGAGGMLNLYRATELGTAGTISSIACRLYSDATATSYSNYKVIIGHSIVDTLDTTAASNFVSQTTAMNGTVTVPVGLLAGDWLEIPLTTPFVYDGVSNLAIWMGTTAASGASADTICRMSTTDYFNPSYPLYTGHAADGAPGAGSVSLMNNKFDMRLKVTK